MRQVSHCQMKRTLKRRAPSMRRTGSLRRLSAARRKRNAEVQPVREQYRFEHSICEVCRRTRAAELHEILRGKLRSQCLDKPALLLAVCRKCHDLIQPWKLTEQLWLKREAGSGYDLEIVRAVWNGDRVNPGRLVEEADVDAAGESVGRKLGNLFNRRAR